MPKYSVLLSTSIEVRVDADDPWLAALTARFQVLHNVMQHLPPRFISVGFSPDHAFQVREVISERPGIRNVGPIVLRGSDGDLDPR